MHTSENGIRPLTGGPILSRRHLQFHISVWCAVSFRKLCTFRPPAAHTTAVGYVGCQRSVGWCWQCCHWCCTCGCTHPYPFKCQRKPAVRMPHTPHLRTYSPQSPPITGSAGVGVPLAMASPLPCLACSASKRVFIRWLASCGTSCSCGPSCPTQSRHGACGPTGPSRSSRRPSPSRIGIADFRILANA